MKLLFVCVGDLLKVCVGELVMMIGVLDGLGNMVMVGIVSVMLCWLLDGSVFLFFEIDIVLNFDNLGGLVFNCVGDVIGIVV